MSNPKIIVEAFEFSFKYPFDVYLTTQLTKSIENMAEHQYQLINLNQNIHETSGDMLYTLIYKFNPTKSELDTKISILEIDRSFPSNSSFERVIQKKIMNSTIKFEEQGYELTELKQNINQNNRKMFYALIYKKNDQIGGDKTILQTPILLQENSSKIKYKLKNIKKKSKKSNKKGSKKGSKK
jgi:hypothetical protein